MLVRGSESLAKTKDGQRSPRGALTMWQWDPIRDWLDDATSRAYWTTPLLLAVQIVMVMVCLILVMAFYTLAERKVIGWIQARKGPNRVNLLVHSRPRASRSRTWSS